MESLEARKVSMTDPLTNICGVCGAPAPDVLHYGSIACYSCRAFFRRNVGKDLFKCGRAAGACMIDEVNRTNCKICRFNACLQVEKWNIYFCSLSFLPQIGMKPEKVGGNKKGKAKMTSKNKLLPHAQDQKEIINTKFELIPQNPILKFTLEEEFKIHEIDAMQETLLDMCQISVMGVIKSGYFSTSQGTFLSSETILSRQSLLREAIKGKLLNCKLLDCCYNYKQVPDKVKLETLNFSLTVNQICWRAFFKANSNKKNLVDQIRAAGRFPPAFEKYIEQNVNGFDHK